MIYLKSRAEIDTMRRASVIVAEVLQTLKETVKPGMTTLDLDEVAERMTYERGAKPAFKGYSVGGRVFNHSLCTSINEEIVHGIPSDRVLKEGDILSMDFGVVYEGFYGDSAVTVGLGQVNSEAERLMQVTETALSEGIETLREGNRLGDLGSTIQGIAERSGYSVVREFVGHGIGKKLHEEPPVPNYGDAGKGFRLRAGMVLAVEPMVNAGKKEISILEDGWTAVTRDRSLAAHFEHSIAITADGPFVLSRL